MIDVKSPENSTVPTSKITTPLMSHNKYPESYFASPLDLQSHGSSQNMSISN